MSIACVDQRNPANFSFSGSRVNLLLENMEKLRVFKAVAEGDEHTTERYLWGNLSQRVLTVLKGKTLLHQACEFDQTNIVDLICHDLPNKAFDEAMDNVLKQLFYVDYQVYTSMHDKLSVRMKNKFLFKNTKNKLLDKMEKQKELSFDDMSEIAYLFKKIQDKNCPFLSENTSIKLRDFFIRFRNKNGEQLIHLAAKEGHLHLLYNLLFIDSSLVFATTDSGETPLEVAKANNQSKAIPYLQELERLQKAWIIKRPHTLQGKLEKTSDPIVKLLENRAILLGAKTPDGEMAIHIAAKNGNVQIIESLLAIDLRLIHIKTPDGEMAIHIAAKNGNVQIIESLLAIDLRLIHIKTSDGEMAIHIAAKNGNVQIIESLLAIDLRLIHIKTADGKTPYMIAVDKKQEEAAAYLSRILCQPSPRLLEALCLEEDTYITDERNRTLEALSLEIDSFILGIDLLEHETELNPTTFDPFTDIFICPKDFRA
ncbi:MAG: ankyrin repeat domain-containing protein [Chlamydiales bacterium]|nr:ankyrin repeat domain-containing protein [Chlamydiales bacterium]